MTRHAHDARTDTQLTRRGFVAAAGGAAATALAGCSNVTRQSFGATPVVLPEADRESLALAQTGLGSETISREGPTGSVEVSITSHAAAYRRGPAREAPTVLERFASSVNGTPGSGSAIVLPAMDAPDLDATGNEVAIDLAFLEGTPSVSGGEVGLVVPEGARDTEPLGHGKLMALVPGTAIGTRTVTYSGDGPGAFFPNDVFFPGDIYFPSDTYFPDDLFFPDDTFSPDPPDDFRAFVPNVETLLDRVGMDALPEGARRVESGETMAVDDLVITCEGNGMLPEGALDGLGPSVFDEGVMLPLAGQPFGLATLATPDASVADRSANPLVDMETAELLQHEALWRELLPTLVGGDGAMGVEWRVGPELVQLPSTDTSLLGTKTDLESFIGVVSGDDGPWGILVTVGRVTDDDHVVAASAIARPVGPETVEGSGWGMDRVASNATVYERAVEFTAESIGRLVARPGATQEGSTDG